MDYRILGPLEVCQDGRTLELPGDKQRALVAMLLLHANQAVSADRLIDGLWGERPPPTANKALQVHVSRLRRALDTNGRSPAEPSDGVLVTRGHGYLLRVEPGELDVDRFRTLVQDGRRALATGDADLATRLLADALALWRGPPLADFNYEAFAQEAIAELEELYLGAVEEHVDAELALGRHEQVIGELTTLVRRNPLRERLRAQLMLALYRSGRETDALDVYQEFRRNLSEQLGLDPGPRLQQLHAAILTRDPSLEPPPATPPSEPPATVGPPSPPARERRRRRLAVAGLALVAVAAGLVSWVGGGSETAAVIAADSVGAIGPSSGAIGADVPVGASPSGEAAGDGAVWVTNYNDGTVSRIDPAAHSVQTIQTGSTPSGIAVGTGAVWVANNFDGTVSRIDPTVNRVVQKIPVGNGPSGIAVGYGRVWVANSSDGTLSRINAITGAPSTPIRLGGGATDVAAGYGAVWVSDAADGRVLRVDPHTGQIQPIDVGGTGPSAITVGFGSVWVANNLDASVSRINAQTTQVEATIPVGNGPNALAVGSGAVWVANEFGDTVARINPATNTVTQKIAVGNSPRGLAVAGGVVWVSAQATAARHRGGTLNVLVKAPFDGIDPAFTPALASWLTLSMTNDGLTSFKRVGGSDGAQVEPDLAVRLPTPTNGGLTYTFQLRRGIRYSNGAPVRPEDFRTAAERDLRLTGPSRASRR